MHRGGLIAGLLGLLAAVCAGCAEPAGHPCCPDGAWQELRPSDGRAPAEAWCTIPGPPSPSVAPPGAMEEALHAGVRFDPAGLSCPTDFSRWVPFVDRTTAGIGAGATEYVFDENGVPLVDLSRIHPGAGFRYSPISIGMYATLLFGDTLTGDLEAVDKLRAQGDWLVENAVPRYWQGTRFDSWEFDIDNLYFGFEAPSSSAYALGVILPGLVGAFCATGDARYLAAAERGLATFIVPMNDGGMTTWIDDEHAWYEEGADVEGASSRILNGHIAAVAGLWAVSQWTGSALAADLVDAGVRTAKADMHLHDPGFLSTYAQWASPDFFPLVAYAEGYNRFHASQIAWLYELTGDVAFLAEALQVARYDDPHLTVSTSGALAGQANFAEHKRMVDRWVEASGGWVEWTLEPGQTVDGVTVWAHDPELLPSEFDVTLDRAGSDPVVITRPWPQGCHDTHVPTGSLVADRVRVTVRGRAGADVGLRAAGVHRSTGHPTAAAPWIFHSETNRPASMFGPEGWVHPPGTWVVLDLHDSFLTLELAFADWPGAAVPTLLVGDALDALAPVAPTVLREQGGLQLRLDPVPARFLRVVFPESGWGAERRMWARPIPDPVQTSR